MSENRDTRAIFGASHCADEMLWYVDRAICFSKKRFSLDFYRGNFVFFSWNRAWNFVIHRGKPKFISLPVKFPADRSKFQFCTTTTRSKLIIIFTRTVLPCLCFFSKSSGRNNAKYAFQYTFKDNTTQYAKKKKKKKRKNKVGTFTTIFAVGYPSSSQPRQTGLNLSGATKNNEFRESYCEIRISSLCCDVVHELSSVWRLCIKFCKGVYWC